MTNRTPRDLDSEERDFLARHRSEIEALRKEASACPHPDTLSAAVMGVLSNEESACVHRHAAGCAICSTLRDGLESVTLFEQSVEARRLKSVAARESASAQTPPQMQASGLFARPLAVGIAAALILLAGIGVLSEWRGPWRSQTPTGRSAISPARQAGVLFLLPLEKAALKLPLDALTWRGSERSSSAVYLAELGRALAPYNRDDYAEAVQELTALGGRYRSAIEPSFYLGVSQLFLNRPNDAREALERARESGGAALALDIEWYLAVANERGGEPRKAGQILAALCGKESAYRTRSCEIYPRLAAGPK